MGIFGDAPKVEASTDSLKEDKRKVKKARTALLETEGGVLGEEVEPENIKPRERLLGF